MGSVYSPVFSLKTGWVVGKIVSHAARPLEHDEVEKACADLERIPELQERLDQYAKYATQLEAVEHQKIELERQVDALKGAINRDFVSHEDGEVTAAHCLTVQTCDKCGELVVCGKKVQDPDG